MRKRPGQQKALRLTIIFICCHAWEVLAADKVKLPVGKVSEVAGAPDVLREPSKTLTPELKGSGKKQGYAAVLFEGSYWKAYPIVPGSVVYYGDVLSSGPESQMVLSFHDGFKIILAKNTKVRITPEFVKANPNSLVSTWLYLLNGKIRAYLYGHDEKPRTEFRTRTLAMGVRGTEFMMSVDQGHSKILTIDGEIFARPVTAREAEIVEKASAAFISKDEAGLSQNTEELKQVEIGSEITLLRGEKVERTELPPPSVLVSLPESEKAALLARQTNFASQPIQQDDVKEAQEIGENIQQLILDKRQTELESLAEDLSRQSPEQPVAVAVRPPHQFILLRLGLGGLNVSHEDIEASGGGVNLSLDYLPNAYSFASVELGHDDWRLQSFHSHTDLGPDNLKIKGKDPLYYLIAVGGRWPFSASFSAAAALSYVGARQFVLSHEDKRSFTFQMRASTILRLELSYQFTDEWQLFLNLGGGGTRARVLRFDPSKGPGPEESTWDMSQGYSRFGLGRFF